LKIKLINNILLFVVGYLLVSCANPVTPSGGPKDADPPEFLKSDPPLYIRNFNEEKIKITFNEFIVLKDLNNQIIISPPMNSLPEFKLKGKSLVIEFQEKLLENTTYNLFFGNAIVDLRENNPFENFQFIFSTGNVIDSLSIQGQLYNAFNLKPMKSINVMLYSDNNDTIPFDSLPYFVRPYYMTKTDEEGNFSLKNLAYRDYKLFVLEDLNGNLIYDQPTESIGFIDETIFPIYRHQLSEDSISADTGITKKILPPVDTVSLYRIAVFLETDSVQRFMKSMVPKRNEVVFIFKRPVEGFNIKSLSEGIIENWAITEYNPTGDSIIYWVKEIGKDSLKMEITENNIILDTINVALHKKAKGKKTDNEKPAKLEIKNNLQSSKIDLNKPLLFTFGYPLESIDTPGIRIFEQDTIPMEAIYSFADSVHRKIQFDQKWKKSTSYTLIIRDSTFCDILNHWNDSIILKFSSKSPEDYGNLFINCDISNPGTNLIVQLFSGEVVVNEAIIFKSERLSFPFLTPGKYTLKMITDDNNNGKWDTGDYFYNIQPEKVRFFPSEINVRANWDVEEDWKL
jgi:hypothetical protein